MATYPAAPGFAAREPEIYQDFTSRLALRIVRYQTRAEGDSDPDVFHPHGTYGPDVPTVPSPDNNFLFSMTSTPDKGSAIPAQAMSQTEGTQARGIRASLYKFLGFNTSSVSDRQREQSQDGVADDVAASPGTDDSGHSHTSAGSANVFPLLRLPDEITLRVMSYMPASSLYCVRQTSRFFMNLFDSEELAHYHPVNSSYERYLAFSRRNLDARSTNEIIASLHHGDLCDACLAHENKGPTSAAEEELRQPKYCNGCHEEHSSIFFYPDDVERHKRHGSPLICIGRLGEVSLCGHSTCKATRWSDLEKFRKKSEQWRTLHDTEIYYEVACVDRSHQPSNARNASIEDLGLPFPRLIVSSKPSLPSNYHFALGWELPLMLYDHTSPPSLAVLREALSSAVRTRLPGQRLCPHVTIDKELTEYVRTGTCDHFTARKFMFNMHGQMSCYLYEGSKKCHCERTDSIECRSCGATFCWLVKDGLWCLLSRYSWEMEKPTSFGWLCRLDNDDVRRWFSAQEHRHVTWCDGPGCWLADHPRWEGLVKAALEDDFNRLPRGSEARRTHDYNMMWEVAKFSTFRTW